MAEAYLEQRKVMEFPMLREIPAKPAVQSPLPASVSEPADFLLEIGVEELPAQDTSTGIESLRSSFEELVLNAHGLSYGEVKAFGTPRRLVLQVSDLAPREQDSQAEVKGPPELAAFDREGKPTPALLGWKRKHQLDLGDDELTRERLVREMDGGRYVVWRKGTMGAPTATLLSTLLPEVISRIKFEKSMRWNETGVAFSRPIRWLVALYGEAVIPFEYAGVASANVTRGLRPDDSPDRDPGGEPVRGRDAACRHCP